ncbi:hypothetical protein ACFOWX_08710 [Sphingorhabdus arenilitoris]|uniref:Transmembrane protein 18 n=1 Tax=Sphingorhabdus arenilitoris TaxID=1490041 RepID=A0ABV8RGX4_9SPHN
MMLFRNWVKMDWIQLKIWIQDVTGLERDALHIYAAIAIQLCGVVLFRKSVASALPWILVLIFAVGNEWLDNGQTVHVSDLSHREFDESYKDLWNTMLLPTILFALSNLFPHFLVGKQRLSENMTNEILAVDDENVKL